MQTIHSVVRPAVLVAGAAVLLASAAAPVEAAAYKSPSGYQITAPAGWNIRKGGLSAEVAMMGPGGSSIAIVSIAMPSTVTLERARASTIAAAKKAPRIKSYRELGQGSMTVGGARALSVSATYLMGSPPQKIRSLQVFALRGGKVHLFTCTALASKYAASDAAFQNALRSVRWTK